MKKNYVYAFITVLIWATLAVEVKLLLSSIPNLEILCISGFAASAFLFLINLGTGKLRQIRQYRPVDLWKMAGLGFLGLFLYSFLYYYGIGVLTAQEACILNYLWPLMIMLFSALILGESMTLGKIFAMVCSFVGIIVLTMGSSDEAGGHSLTGMLACIIAAACYGLFSVLNKKADYDQNISMMILWLTVGICSLATGPLVEKWVMLSAVQWLGLIWLGAIVNGLAYLLWALALNGEEESAGIANIAYLTPFLSVVFCFIVLKEEIHLNAVLALVLIVGGILIQGLAAGRKKTS